MAYEYFGTDVRFNTSRGDVYPLPAGDLALTDKADLVLQDLWLRLVTPKGDLWAHPTYGVDVYAYLHREDTLTNRMALCAAIREEARKDPRVKPESITVRIADWNSGTHELVVELECELEGHSNKYDLVLGYDLRVIDDTALQGGEYEWQR